MTERTFGQALQEATDHLVKLSIPLYRDDRGRPDLCGTGFFVRTERACFLVSAAHVMDVAMSVGLFYYSKPSQARHLSGQMRRSQGIDNRDHDLTDIGVLELSKNSWPPYPEVDKFAMPARYLAPALLPRGPRQYLFVGFPATMADTSGARRETTVTAYSYHGKSIDDALYARHGLNPTDHIAMAFDARHCYSMNGIKVTFPKPNGMSGSPIVCIYDEKGDNSSPHFQIVGVATKCYASRRLIVGADVSYVLDAIAAADQHARRLA